MYICLIEERLSQVPILANTGWKKCSVDRIGASQSQPQRQGCFLALLFIIFVSFGNTNRREADEHQHQHAPDFIHGNYCVRVSTIRNQGIIIITVKLLK